MATKLQAVNEVLQRLGKMPVKFLDTGGTSTHAHVERLLDNASDMVQGQGWNWNSKDKIDVSSNSDTQLQVNNLELGAGVSLGGITKANPCVVSATDHGFKYGDEVYISDVLGMSEINDRSYVVTPIDSGSFELDGVDSTDYSTYAANGTVQKSQHIYHVDTTDTDAYKNYTRRGPIMYDEDNQTFTITGTTKLGYIYQYDFEDVPDSFQKWIVAQTAFDFNRYYIGNQTHDQLLQVEIADTKRQAAREEIRSVDTNVLNQQPMRQIRGRRRMPDRSIY